jgi:hypothetical protein
LTTDQGGEPPADADALYDVSDAEPASDRIIVVLFHGFPGRFESISRDLVDQFQDRLAAHKLPPRETTVLDVWLDSPGGDADAAYKLGLVLRSVARRIRVVIPDYAKSAGTLLALVADEIYMAPAAELGPLDAQIGYEQEGMTISALDRGRSLEDLTDTAMEIVLSGGGSVLQSTRLSRAETITAMLDFAAKFLEPVVSKLDPTILHWSNAILRVAVEYGNRLIATHEEPASAELKRLPRKLVEEFPAHGFVISPEEAARLGLPVYPMDAYEDSDEVLTWYRHAKDAQLNVVEVLVRNSTDPDDAGDEEEDSDGSEEGPDGE